MINKNDFIEINCEDIKIIFSTAENKRSFNRHTEDGVKELNLLKDEFGIDEVVYLRQVHSDKVYVYSGDREEFIENEGDAIITNIKNVGIGVFTADCVPVILVDPVKKVIGAIHSGWKGTYSSITLNTLKKMSSKFSCEPSDIKVYIGPHIRQCCYEISEELKQNFIDKKIGIDKECLFDGRKLNMELCIIEDAKGFGITEENINSLNLCTHCSKEVKLFSYRKSQGTYGRLFAFAYIK